jgi:hypothetical protein
MTLLGWRVALRDADGCVWNYIAQRNDRGEAIHAACAMAQRDGAGHTVVIDVSAWTE